VAVYRYKFNSNNEIADPDHPEKIVTDLVAKGQHASKSIALDDKGNIYVNVGHLPMLARKRTALLVRRDKILVRCLKKPGNLAVQSKPVESIL
jgi:glucose/arabinose dehydrogenase